MKITKIETEIKQIELKTPFKTALRTATHVEIIKSIQAGLEDVKSGKVQPIEKLWNQLDN